MLTLKEYHNLTKATEDTPVFIKADVKGYSYGVVGAVTNVYADDDSGTVLRMAVLDPGKYSPYSLYRELEAGDWLVKNLRSMDVMMLEPSDELNAGYLCVYGTLFGA